MSAGAGAGGFYQDGGPHPFVSFAVSGHVGPLEVMAAPVTQLGPVYDLVQASAVWGPPLALRPVVGIGWSWWRRWGTCNAEGHWCEHEWTEDLVLTTGLSYTARPLRVDLRYTFYGGDAPLSGAPWFILGFDIPLGE
jgi:hypothetical protein